MKNSNLKRDNQPRLKIITASQKQAGQLCSICQTGIVSGEEMVNCPDCGLPFHLECWQENQGCSAYGCRSAPATQKSETSASSQQWEQDKLCPACGNKIKAQAIKCHHCGVKFETRMAISRKEYAQREYSGQEYYTARNKIAGLFLASAAAVCRRSPWCCWG